MAEDDFFIAGSNSDAVGSKKDRIRDLFGVDISVTFEDVLEGRCDNAKVHFKSSNNSAKAKAQKYLEAVLGESENFTKKRLLLQSGDLKMVLNDYDKIEEKFQIYIDLPAIENNQICIQGSEDRVTEAYNYIDSILPRRPMSEKSRLWDSKELEGDENPLIQEIKNLQLDQNVKTDLSARGGRATVNLNDSTLSGDDLETDLAAREWGDHSDDETDRILSHPDHSDHVEKALRLGYSEDQIAAVLKKLGTTARSVDPNTLLSELIKEGATSPDSDINMAPFVEDTCDDNDNVVLLENADDSSNLRHIVIDGSNVAMSHGYKEVFSCRGIKIAVDYFRQRGHKKITVFVPQWRKETSRPGAQIKDQEIMRQLEKEKVLVFTPSRRIGGKRVVCYDDRFILDLAHDKNGIVVSNDNYRDLHNEKAQYKKAAEEQLLPYLFADDKFMPPEDPLGKHGPTLDNFLRIKPVVSEPLQPCPYGKKCTYGNKCRFAHPERGNRPQRSVTDMLSEQSYQKIKDRAIKLEDKKKKERSKQLLKRTKSLFPETSSSLEMKTNRAYHRSETVDESKDSKISREKNIEKSDINIILDEHRRKLSEQIKSREASPVPTFDIQKVSNQSKSENLVHIEPQITELPSFGSTLPPPQFSTQTSVATESDNHRGVIQLVKKLSDEANESGFFVNERSQPSSNVSTHSSVPQTSWTQIGTHSQAQEPRFEHQSQDTYSQVQEPRFENQSQVTYSQTQEPRYEHQSQTQEPRLEHQSQFNNLPYRSGHRLPSNFSVPPYPSHHETYYSAPPTYMRQNAVQDSYDGRLQSYPFMESNPYGVMRSGVNQGYQNTVGYMDSMYHYPPNHSVLVDRGSQPDQIQHQHQSPMMRLNSYPDTQLQAMHDQEQARMQQNLHHRGVNSRHAGSSQVMRQASGITSPPTQPPSPYLPSGYYSSQPPITSNIWPASQPGTLPYQQPVFLPTSPPYVPDAEILPSDPRYSTYSHLCNLFDKSKVRAVMNEHPNEKDPKKLCTYIIQ